MNSNIDSRRDLAMAITVEIGAATLALAGREAALDYLLGAGAPPDVTARILAGQPRGAGTIPDAAAGRP